MYNKVETNMNFVEREKATEKFWADNQIFEKSMKDREGNEIVVPEEINTIIILI